MEVIVKSDQISRLSERYFDNLYGKLHKYKGKTFDEVYVDDYGNPRIATYRKIFESPTVYITIEDFEKFTKVIPLGEREFGEVFRDWFKKNYFDTDFNKLTTTTPNRMEYLQPLYRNPYVYD